MYKTLIFLTCLSAGALLFHGCTTDEDEESSLCPELVQFMEGCYEEKVGRPPPETTVEGWLASCSSDHHSDDCIRCAMEQSCDDHQNDWTNGTNTVFNVLCAERCP